MNTAQLFENPLQQTYHMKQRLLQSLNQNVAEEIIAFSQMKANEKYNHILDTLIQRVHKIDRIYETKTESKSEYFERMQMFLKETNPSTLASEIKRVLVFDEVEVEFKKLSGFFSKGEFGKFYLRYQFDQQAFKALSAGLLSDIHIINKNLERYAQAVTAHVEVMKSIKNSTGFKTVIKVGTRITGSLLAGPLGSIAGGALANALTNDDGKISDSYGHVIDAWSQYLNVLDEFLLKLKDRYEHILLTLVGGLFLRVSQDLNHVHVTIKHLTLLDYSIKYGIKKNELQKYEIWMSNTLKGILEKIDNRQYEIALKATDELFHFIEKHPLLKYEAYHKEKSYLYVATLYKYAAISTFAWSKKDQKKTFHSMIYKLFKNMPLVLREADIAALHVPTQLELAITVVAQWVEENSLQQNGVIFPDLILRAIDRYENSRYFLGEPDDDDLFASFSVSIGKYLCIQHNMEMYKFFVEKVNVNIPALKKLIQTYKDISQRNKDKMITFMKSMILSRRVGYILYYIKKPIVIIILTVFLFSVGIWLLRDSWLPIFQNENENVIEYENEIENEIITQEVDTPVATSEKLYHVQAGAFSSNANALALESDLKSHGFETTIKKSGELYIVQVGAYRVKKNAEDVLVELQSVGFEGFVKYE